MNRYTKHLMETGQVCVPYNKADETEKAIPKGTDYRSACIHGNTGCVYWIGDENRPANLSSAYGKPFAVAGVPRTDSYLD